MVILSRHFYYYDIQCMNKYVYIFLKNYIQYLFLFFVISSKEPVWGTKSARHFRGLNRLPDKS